MQEEQYLHVEARKILASLPLLERDRSRFIRVHDPPTFAYPTLTSIMASLPAGTKLDTAKRPKTKKKTALTVSALAATPDGKSSRKGSISSTDGTCARFLIFYLSYCS
jgi:hypothetical protein